MHFLAIAVLLNKLNCSISQQSVYWLLKNSEKSGMAKAIQVPMALQ